MFSANASQVSNDVKYIEDFCSVYLRTGTGSSQTVTTGVKENTGALVISKSRSAATDWAWYDTFRGATYDLVSNSTAAQTTQAQGLTSFNADGHTWGTLAKVNTSGATYVDTVLKPTPKFFDVVTFTATSAGKVYHSLGSLPGFILWKSTSNTGDWFVLARNSDTRYSGLKLNSTAAEGLYGSPADLEITSTYFTPDASWGATAGQTFVAYFFAHNAGGFGLTGTDNVISCGSFVGTGGVQDVTLGYEPQWLLFKNASSGTANWTMVDNMRGWGVASSTTQNLFPNLSNAETNANYPKPTATGFQHAITSGETAIYIAIRRGPMKVPTDGAKVYTANTYGSGGNPPSFLSTFPVDMMLFKNKASAVDWRNSSRLLQGTQLSTNTTAAETTNALNAFDYMNGWQNDTGTNTNVYSWMLRRAPGFFDVVCDTGTGASHTITHGLTVSPELLIRKQRSGVNNWCVYASALGNTKVLNLESTGSPYTDANAWNSTSPTSSVFSVGTSGETNTSGGTFVTYLFASCPGVSKVGSYTGTGTTQQINCGFTAGARFVLIKRTDSSGDWYVWDSARGIVSGNDPYLLMNSTAAEVTTTDYIDTYSAGFEISSTAPAAINASGGSFVYLAIA